MKKILCIVISMLFGFLIGLLSYKQLFLNKTLTFKSDEVMDMNYTRPIEELKKLVVTKGDTAAYDELSIAYLNVNIYEEYLLYSFIMANKYHYHTANYDVYFCLTNLFEHHKSMGSIDEKTKALAISYLQRGVDLNDYQSLCEMAELYMDGKYVKKNIARGKVLLRRKDELEKRQIKENSDSINSVKK